MRYTTLLGDEAKIEFAARLCNMVLDACQTTPHLKRDLSEALGWPNLSRLSDYKKGKFFVTPDVLVRIARIIGADWLSLLADAGYLREVLPLLHALSQFDGGDEHRAFSLPSAMTSREIAVQFAVLKFPLRDEWRRPNPYADVLLTQIFGWEADRAKEALDRRSRMPKYLRAASEALASDLDAEVRRSIAAEYVRAWARSIDADLTRTLTDRYSLPALPPITPRESVA